MALLALLTLSTAGGPAFGQIQDKRAEAASIVNRLQEQARQIVRLDIDYRNAQAELADAEASVKKAEADLTAAGRRQDELRRSLVVQAQDAYVLGGSVSVIRYLMSTKQGDEVVRRAYLRLVAGQDRKVIGELRAVKEDLEDLRKRLDDARKRARAKAGAIAGERADLDKAVRSQRAVLAQVNGEIATLVAAEQARRDAAAAALRIQSAAPSPAAGAPAPAAASPVVLEAPNGDVWACIRQLESGNNYSSPSGGAYQFLDSTWQSLGYTGQAEDHPPAVQDQAARELQARSGWSQWTVAPLCGRA